VKHAKPRRRRGRILVGAAIGALVVAALGAAGLGLRTSLAVDDIGAASPAPSVQATTVPADHAEPVERVVILGDSLVVGAEPALRSSFEDRDVELTVVGGTGEGFLSPDAHWLDELADAVSRTDPQVVVIEACCNIPSSIALPGGRAVLADSDEAYDEWEAAARRAVSTASARGATVMWVVTPQVVPSSPSRMLAGRITALNGIYARLGVDLIDWDAALRGEDARRVRAGDGLHLTGAGSEVVAEATVEAVMAP
jgi:hypothetical protein